LPTLIVIVLLIAASLGASWAPTGYGDIDESATVKMSATTEALCA